MNQTPKNASVAAQRDQYKKMIKFYTEKKQKLKADLKALDEKLKKAIDRNPAKRKIIVYEIANADSSIIYYKNLNMHLSKKSA